MKLLRPPEPDTNLANTGERFLPSIVRSSTGLEHYHRYLIAAAVCEGKEVLDIACGEGYGAAIIAQGAARVWAVDIDRESVALAKSKYAASSNLRFVCGDCAAIPLRDASVDVVISVETIEHITGQRVFLDEVKRVLRPDGVLILSSPNKTPYNLLNAPNDFHVKELEKPELRELLGLYFRHIGVAEQQALYGSVVDSASPNPPWYFERHADHCFHLSHELNGLVYSIVFASDNPSVAVVPPRSMLLDTHFDGSAHRYHEHSAVYEIRDPGDRLLKQQNVALEKTADGIRGDLRRREADLGELSRHSNESAARIQEFDTQLQTLTAQLQAARAAADQGRRAWEQSAKAIAAVGSERDRLRVEVDALRASLSWRLTALPRAVLNALVAVARRVGVRRGPLTMWRHWVSGGPPDSMRAPVQRFASLAGRAASKLLLCVRGLRPTTARAIGVVRRSGLFDPHHYRRKYQDVADHGDFLCAVHYAVHGWREGREPGTGFDPGFYLAAYPEVRQARANPLLHYVLHGRREGRSPREPGESERLPAAVTRWDTPHGRNGAVAHSPATSVTTFGPSSWSLGATRTIDREADHWRDFEQFRAHVAGRRLTARRGRGARRPALLRVDPAGLQDAVASIDSDLRVVDTPEVSIVIPVHDQLVVTLECLLAIARNSAGARIEVVVVDDASSAETASCLARLAAIRYVRQDQQAGFGATCNRGVAECRGDVVVLLNSDTQVQPGWLPDLVDPLRDPSVAMVGPKLLFPDGLLQEAGGRLRADGSGEMVGLFEDAAAPRFSYPRTVDYVSAACAAFRRADFAAVGGFDQAYAPAYAEDADLCLKLQQLGKRIVYAPLAEVVHHLSKTTSATGQLNKVAMAAKHQQVLETRWGPSLQQRDRVRVLAFYLPQFHAVDENDRWWGEGFTEWRNVAGARPRFEGHLQPKIPADLGYYDLRTPGVMAKQAQLAQRYGVSGFAIYYYRFGDRRVLSMPVETITADLTWTFPFCLVWANENWTRRWDGKERDVLLRQEYGADELNAILDDFVRSFAHPAYIRVNGAPLLLIYRPRAVPNARETIANWRETCRRNGVGEIYVVAVESFELMRQAWDPSSFGYDATVEFPPHESGQPSSVRRSTDPTFTGVVHDYRRVVDAFCSRDLPPYKRFRCVMPGWDNTARRRNDSHVFENAGPAEYQVWLEFALRDTRAFLTGDERLVFVNAWNEWAEGAYLEPDHGFGHGHLEATRNALEAERWLP